MGTFYFFIAANFLSDENAAKDTALVEFDNELGSTWSNFVTGWFGVQSGNWPTRPNRSSWIKRTKPKRPCRC